MIPIRRLSVLAAVAALLPLASCRAPLGLADDGCVKVQGTFDPRAPGYIVLYKEGVPVQATTAELAAKYGFTPKYVWEAALQGFAAPLSDAAVQGLRCESVIKHIEHDQIVTVG